MNVRITMDERKRLLNLVEFADGSSFIIREVDAEEHKTRVSGLFIPPTGERGENKNLSFSERLDSYKEVHDYLVRNGRDAIP